MAVVNSCIPVSLLLQTEMPVPSIPWIVPVWKGKLEKLKIHQLDGLVWARIWVPLIHFVTIMLRSLIKSKSRAIVERH